MPYILLVRTIPHDSNGHLHNEEESGDDDIGEIPGKESQQEGGEDAVLRAHAGGFFYCCLFVILIVIVIVFFIVCYCYHHNYSGSKDPREGR